MAKNKNKTPKIAAKEPQKFTEEKIQKDFNDIGTPEIPEHFGKGLWVLLSVQRRANVINITEAMRLNGGGCFIRTSTVSPNGQSESLTFLQGVAVVEITDDKGNIIGRELTR